MHDVSHGVDFFAADIRNSFLQAPKSDNNYIICGPEFGLDNIGKRDIIRRALCGRKYAGRDFINLLQSFITHLDFKLVWKILTHG